MKTKKIIKIVIVILIILIGLFIGYKLYMNNKTYTLIEMYEQAEKDGCTNEDGKCKNKKHLHIGDYVKYKNPDNGKYISKSDKTGYTFLEDGQEFEINENKNQLNWRVLGKDESGVIKLIGSCIKSNNESPYFYMSGAYSYLNGEEELNKICKLYTTEYGDARSIKIEDINDILEIIDEEKIKEYNINTKYNGLQYGEQFQFDNQYTPTSWISGNTEEKVTGEVTGYTFTINSSRNDGTKKIDIKNKRVFDMLFNNVNLKTGAEYWLASPSVCANANYASYGIGKVYKVSNITSCGSYGLMFSTEGDKEGCSAVRPVITLKRDVTNKQVPKTEDIKEEIWNY